MMNEFMINRIYVFFLKGYKLLTGWQNGKRNSVEMKQLMEEKKNKTTFPFPKLDTDMSF